jgi:hypothetical protein
MHKHFCEIKDLMMNNEFKSSLDRSEGPEQVIKLSDKPFSLEPNIFHRVLFGSIWVHG